MDSFQPYHFLNLRGSKYPDWLYEPASTLTAATSHAHDLSLTRRDAMKLGVLGAAGVAAGLGRPANSQANPALAAACWWVGKKVFEAAITWVVTKVADYYLSTPVEKVMTYAAGLASNVVEKPKLISAGEVELKSLPPGFLHQRHRETDGDYQIRADYALPESRMSHYDDKREFGIKRYVLPMDLNAGAMVLVQREADIKGLYDKRTLIATTYRTVPLDDSRTKRRFNLAVKLYDLRIELTFESVAYVQTTLDVANRPLTIFGLKDDIAQRASFPAPSFDSGGPKIVEQAVVEELRMQMLVRVVAIGSLTLSMSFVLGAENGFEGIRKHLQLEELDLNVFADGFSHPSVVHLVRAKGSLKPADAAALKTLSARLTSDSVRDQVKSPVHSERGAARVSLIVGYISAGILKQQDDGFHIAWKLYEQLGDDAEAAKFVESTCPNVVARIEMIALLPSLFTDVNLMRGFIREANFATQHASLARSDVQSLSNKLQDIERQYEAAQRKEQWQRLLESHQAAKNSRSERVEEYQSQRARVMHAEEETLKVYSRAEARVTELLRRVGATIDKQITIDLIQLRLWTELAAVDLYRAAAESRGGDKTKDIETAKYHFGQLQKHLDVYRDELDGP